jgi:hypothetical protein
VARKRNVILTALSLVAVIAFALFMIHVLREGLKLVANVSAVHAVDSSHVSVAWKVRNTGNNPAFFKSCMIELGGDKGVSGEWTGGNTGIIFTGTQKTFTTLVKVENGSATLVTVDGTKVSCDGLVNAHSGI